ncbi:MAG: hypothetical protein LBU62_11815 [Bacteroidales bacterium]|jgi:hypothetical protein|nr:hypothetical protein [Bacteroidales bacterium]
MKTINIKITAILLILAGSFSCGKDKEIDFSNIEDLYAQPLPVIQKAVQGKWKVYVSCGGVVGCVYPKNSFFEITSNETIEDNDVGDHTVRSYSWKKKKVDINGKMVNTHITWPDDADETEKSSQAGRYFICIKNDTLYSNGCSLASDWTIMGHTYIRVK